MAEYIISQRINDIITQFSDKTAYSINDTEISYKELGEMAKHIASGLAYKIGELGNDSDVPVRIGIHLPRHTHYVPCIVAAVMLHCSYVPIDLHIPKERHDFIVQDCEMKFVINEDNLQELLEFPISGNLPDYRQNLSEAYMIYTSGTTGKPKGVSIPYKSLLNFMQVVSRSDYHNISSESVTLQFASINFDVSVQEIFSSLYYGGTLVIAQDEDRKDAVKLYNLINDKKITFVTLPPSLIPSLPSVDFKYLEGMSLIGEAVPKNVVSRLLSNGKYRYINDYGPAESTVVTTACVCSDMSEWRSIGKPLPGIICYVLKEDGTLAKPGERGELLIGGKQLANFYWNRPERNAKAFVENTFCPEDKDKAPRLYHSGDEVELNEDGSFNFIGRMDSQVKLHSYRIEINEIIARIEMHERVNRAFVRLEELGNDKYLVAYVSTKDNNEDLSDIREYLAKHVPDYMIPTFWNHLEAFPLNINGKIDKPKLVNSQWNKCTRNSTTLTNEESTLMKCCASILGVDEINVDADLISEVGMTSVQIMQVPVELNVFGIRIGVDDIYNYRTIRSICRNHIYRVSFWYNNPEEHPERPVIAIVSGYTSFSFLYARLAQQLVHKYNIFVIESYHTLLYYERTPVPVLNVLYQNMLAPVAEKYDIKGILGFCFGGEQALLLAHTMFRDKEEKPVVVVVDGEVNRDKDPEHFIPMNWPVLTDKQNNDRREVDLGVLTTMPEDFRYGGKVASILCADFAEQQTITPEEQPTISDYVMDTYREAFRTARQRWEDYYPDADILYIPGHHFQALRTEESINIVANYIHENI